jgi:hypothetical protein
MDCFAALAMTERRGLLHGARRRAFARPVGSQRREAPFLRHCEERSDEAIQSFFAQRDGLLRCARNDGEAWFASRSLSSGARLRDPLARRRRALPSLRGAKRRSNPFFLVAWIASLRSQ